MAINGKKSKPEALGPSERVGLPEKTHSLAIFDVGSSVATLVRLLNELVLVLGPSPASGSRIIATASKITKRQKQP
jgi:hypothetical protein